METSTRDRLIESGMRAMVAKSYHSVGIAEILAEVGVPKGSFYHYFKSKEDFGVEVVKHYWQEGRREIKACLEDPTKSPLERLRAYFEKNRECLVNTGCRQGCLLAKLGPEVAEASPVLRRTIQASMEEWLAVLAGCIRAAQEAGEINPRLDADATAELLLNAWEGATIRMTIRQDPSPLDNFVEQVFGILLAA